MGGFENWENRKNRKRFCLLRKNRWCYDETDTTVGFSASNKSIYILKRKANGSWGMCYERVRKSEKSGKSETFLLVEKESVGLWLNGQDRKSTRLNSSHRCISYAVFCLKKKQKKNKTDV